MTILLNDSQKNIIQIIRGVAIIMVVITHCVLWNPYEIYIRVFVNPAVAIFIFLSGMLTYVDTDFSSIRHFYVRRLKRVFVPYTIWSVIYIIFTGDYEHALIYFVTGNCCSIYYYILVYIQLVIVTPILIMLIRTRLWWAGYIITPVAILVEYIMAYNDIVITYPYNINNLFVWVSFYYLGLNIRGNDKIINCTKKGTVILCSLIILSLALEILEALLFRAYGRGDIATSQLKLSSMITAGILCIMIYRLIISRADVPLQTGPIRKLLIHLGNCSFAIYLTHQLVIMSWNRYLSGFRLNTAYFFIIEAAVVLAVCTGLISIARRLCMPKVGRLLGLY